MCLRDQQYAVRPGRGTLNPLHNLQAVVRRRIQANEATYACFFDVAKAYDSVPHALLLHRLHQCGVTGPAFAVLAAMYSSASSKVRVGSALSPAFAVQRGVAQGCPLSPLLYAVFVDPVLQDMQALSHPDLLWVGPAATRRKLVGQAHADDLAGIAATQQGLQRVVQASICTAFDGPPNGRPSKRGANMTAVLVRAAKLISGIFRYASHTAFLLGRSVNQDVMLSDLDVLSADDHCRMAHARQYARRVAADRCCTIRAQ